MDKEFLARISHVDHVLLQKVATTAKTPGNDLAALKNEVATLAHVMLEIAKQCSDLEAAIHTLVDNVSSQK